MALTRLHFFLFLKKNCDFGYNSTWKYLINRFSLFSFKQLILKCFRFLLLQLIFNYNASLEILIIIIITFCPNCFCYCFIRKSKRHYLISNFTSHECWLKLTESTVITVKFCRNAHQCRLKYYSIIIIV